MKNYETTWTAKNGKEIKVIVINDYLCKVDLDGVEVARDELTKIGNGEICAVIGKVGMVKENYKKVVDLILEKIEADKTPEQKAHDAEMEDYDRHCEMMRRTMAI